MSSNSLQSTEFIDYLINYINEHLRPIYPLAEKRFKNNFLWLLRILAIVAGLTAGLPWIETAQQLGRYSPLIATISSISVVIAFGFTTSWAFSAIIDKLKTSQNRFNHLYAKKTRYYEIGKHITCHLLGMIVTIPTIYISYKYNSKLSYVAIAGTVSYGLSTAGLYQLIDIIKNKLSQKTSMQFIQKDCADKIANKFSFNTETTFIDQFMVRILSAIAFVLAIFNAISIGVLTFKALQHVISSQGITIFLSFMIVLPLFGLDYYAISETFFMVKRKIKNITKQEEGNSLLYNSHPYIYYATPICGLLISAFSTLTDAYVVYAEVGNSTLSLLSLPLSINMWFSKMILETYSVMIVTYNIISLLDRKHSKEVDKKYIDIEKRIELASLIENCDESIFEKFIYSHLKLLFPTDIKSYSNTGLTT